MWPIEAVYSNKKRPIELLRERYDNDSRFKSLVDKLSNMMIDGECSLSDFTGAEAIARERYIDNWARKTREKDNGKD